MKFVLQNYLELKKEAMNLYLCIDQSLDVG